MPAKRHQQLLAVLQDRFEHNMKRHAGIAWPEVLARLEASPKKLASLAQMEATGGEPDVIGVEGEAYLFCDCSPESPTGRRSLCYDGAALQARKENKPKGSAEELAEEMGIELLTEEMYRALQAVGPFDLKTSSWLKAPPEIRKLDGGIFGDSRYGRVFVYHNGVQSYYASRGFRGLLRV